MKEQAVRTENIRQEEFVLQSTATWEQLLEKRKERLSISGIEGRNAQVWLNVRGGMRLFAAYFWHTEGFDP